MTTPPGPHAMTAQAGAVAELTIGTHEHDWGIAPSPAMYRLPAGEYSLYPAPPAAVPVEALEGLVERLMTKATNPYTHPLDSAMLEYAVDELTTLITAHSGHKERSNG